jgi:hypothetical protein
VRKDSAEMVALLTPIVKAFLTDNGHIATNACMQVFGGHGFIKEWGMEQFVRDNRINMIYEGTNTVQSLDLLGRKVLGNNGATLKKFGKLVAQLVEEEGVNEKMAEFINPIAILGDQMTKFTTEIGFKGFQNPDEVGAAAVDYLRVPATWCSATVWARMAQVALREIAAGNTDPFYQGQAADRALLLRQAVPRDRDADAHRARRRQGAAGHRRGAGMKRSTLRARSGIQCPDHGKKRLQGRNDNASLLLSASPPCPVHAGGPVAQHRRQDRRGQGRDPHRRDQRRRAERQASRSAWQGRQARCRLRGMQGRAQGQADPGAGDHPRREEGRGQGRWEGGKILDPENGREYGAADAHRRRQEARSARLLRPVLAHPDLGARAVSPQASNEQSTVFPER